jgi:hypothetical protein
MRREALHASFWQPVTGYWLLATDYFLPCSDALRGEEFYHPPIEGGKVPRAAARDEIAVADERAILPFAARIADVILNRRPARQGAADA